MLNFLKRNFQYIIFPMISLIILIIVILMPVPKRDPGLPLKEIFRSDWKKGFKITIDSIEYVIVTNGEAISIIKHRDLTQKILSGEK